MFLNLLLSFLTYNLKRTTMIKALVRLTPTVLFKICCLEFSPLQSPHLFDSTEMRWEYTFPFKSLLPFTNRSGLFPHHNCHSPVQSVITPSASSCPNPQCLTKKRSQTWQPSALSAFLPITHLSNLPFAFSLTLFSLFTLLSPRQVNTSGYLSDANISDKPHLLCCVSFVCTS